MPTLTPTATHLLVTLSSATYQPHLELRTLGRWTVPLGTTLQDAVEHLRPLIDAGTFTGQDELDVLMGRPRVRHELQHVEVRAESAKLSVYQHHGHEHVLEWYVDASPVGPLW